jgi:hypothetical protein
MVRDEMVGEEQRRYQDILWRLDAAQKPQQIRRQACRAATGPRDEDNFAARDQQRRAGAGRAQQLGV